MDDAVVAELAWPILERIQLVGDFAVSPHGITVALGFVLGAQVMLRRARRRGVARRHVGGVDLVVQDIITRTAIGAILGARFFYVVTRLEQFSSPLEWFTIWEGGLSLLGGIAGGTALSAVYVAKRRLDLRMGLDSAATGLALGIFLGRIGDLVIGEHLGGRTEFALGWRCTDNIGIGPPVPWPGPTAPGCFDVAVHQTALYDFLAGGIIYARLVALERRPRWDGFFAVVFAVSYGTFRFVSDFARAADLDLVGPLTGSQVTSLAVIALVLGWVAGAKPWDRRPWAWNPPTFAHPWDPPGGAAAPVEEGASATPDDAPDEAPAGDPPGSDGDEDAPDADAATSRDGR